MSGRSWKIGALLLSGIAALGSPGFARAQQCTAGEETYLSKLENAGHEKLHEGNVAGYIALLSMPDARLSPACNGAQDVLHPARTRCTVDERKAALTRLTSAHRAHQAGNEGRVFHELAELADEVSSGCWVALNRPTSPTVQAACDADELDFVAGASAPALVAIGTFVTFDDAGLLGALRSAFVSALSPSCLDAIEGFQGGVVHRPAALHNVDPHGGGIYRIAGVGACAADGCMVF